VKCVTFVSDTFTRYGSNITNVWQEILTPVTLAFSCEVVPEKLWKSVNICKSYGEKISGTFFIWTRCIIARETPNFVASAWFQLIEDFDRQQTVLYRSVAEANPVQAALVPFRFLSLLLSLDMTGPRSSGMCRYERNGVKSAQLSPVTSPSWIHDVEYTTSRSSHFIAAGSNQIQLKVGVSRASRARANPVLLMCLRC